MSVFRVTHGGVVFDGSEVLADPFGFQLEAVEGWDDPVSTRSESSSRPSGDGAFNVPSFLDARVIRLSGHVVSRGRAEQKRTLGRLGSLPSRVDAPLSVEDSSGLWVKARRKEASSPVVVFGEYAKFQVTFECRDPFKYGQTEVFSGAAVDVFHFGNAVAVPVIRVTGDMPSGYQVNGPGGRVYRVVQALAPGQTHEIRMRSGWLYRDGVLQHGQVTRMQTWGVPPGGVASMTLVPVAGSGGLSVSVTETWE